MTTPSTIDDAVFGALKGAGRRLIPPPLLRRLVPAVVELLNAWADQVQAATAAALEQEHQAARLQLAADIDAALAVAVDQVRAAGAIATAAATAPKADDAREQAAAAGQQAAHAAATLDKLRGTLNAFHQPADAGEGAA
jgi:hypothetical protein